MQVAIHDYKFDFDTFYVVVQNIKHFAITSNLRH